MTPPAGRELDARVHRALDLPAQWHHEEMLAAIADYRTVNGGRGVFVACEPCGVRGYDSEVAFPVTCACPPDVPAYSSDIRAAWLVVEAMRAKGYGVSIERDKPAFHKWVVRFTHTDPMRGGGSEETGPPDTLPLCICLAALAALGDG